MKRRRFRRTSTATERAAKWFVRLTSDEPPHGVGVRYLQWLQQSPRNIAEALYVAAVYAALRRTRLERLELDDMDASNVIEFPSRSTTRGAGVS